MKNNSFEDLKGKVCVITGGAGVIGASMVEVLASAGVKVAILDLREDIASDLAQKIQSKYNVECSGFGTNVLDKATLIETKKAVLQKFGKVDILINGAGGNSPEATTKLETLDADNVDKLEEGFFGLKMEGFQKVFDLGS